MNFLGKNIMGFKIHFKLCFIVLAFFLVGCSSMQPKEEIIEGNIFKLNYPKIRIDISDEMTYVGKHEVTAQDDWKFDSGSSTYRETIYKFASNKNLSKCVFITVKKIIDSGYWLPIRVGEKKHNILVEQVAINFSGKTWQTWTMGHTCNSDTSTATDSLQLSSDQYNLAKVYMKVSGSDRKLLITVSYIEDISKYESEIQQFKRTRTLSDEGNKYLEGFIKRAESSVVFLE